MESNATTFSIMKSPSAYPFLINGITLRLTDCIEFVINKSHDKEPLWKVIKNVEMKAIFLSGERAGWLGALNERFASNLPRTNLSSRVSCHLIKDQGEEKMIFVWHSEVAGHLKVNKIRCDIKELLFNQSPPHLKTWSKMKKSGMTNRHVQAL